MFYYIAQKSVWVKEDINSAIGNLIEKESVKNTVLKECMMCLINEPNTLFQPCGHGGICFDCSIEIMKKGNIECHFCRGVSFDNVRPYLEYSKSTFTKTIKEYIGSSIAIKFR